MRSVVYDVTRLATRLVYQTPNGIDRIDYAFANYFLRSSRSNSAALMMTVAGPRVIDSGAARDMVARLAAHWGEKAEPSQDLTYQKVVAWIRGESSPQQACERIIHQGRKRSKGITQWIGQHGIPLGHSPVTALPEGSIYLNVSQFPMWIGSYFNWIKRRLDIKSVFFIHDLLPIEAPEYFRKAEHMRHIRRLESLVRFGSAAVVTSKAVRNSLTDYLHSRGRSDLPILVAPIPASPTFQERKNPDSNLSGHTYFVLCSTIEPRKNHLMLLNVWRELVRRDGLNAPKLALVGARGWENENVVDMLERCSTIREHVLEISGLSTPSLKRLLDGACALLMPSFAEGYGLPVVEALAAGVPVIASDLEVFREIGGDRITAISPIDGEKWLETIRRFASGNSTEWRSAPCGTPNWDNYFNSIEAFLGRI